MGSILVESDQFASDPESAWREWFGSGKRVCQQIDKLVSLDKPIYEDKVRFVCISDTHHRFVDLLPKIPDGDILLHCGDFTNFGDRYELEKFNETIGKLPHPYKIVIPGNHELGFDETEDQTKRWGEFVGRGTPNGHELLTNCTLLIDQLIEIYGIKIYGTPWHPLEGFAYYRPRGKPILEKWNLIPEGIDVLLTHTPPLGHGDRHYGDVDLLNTIVERIQPKFHVFGHIHEEAGVTTNGITTFINASSCDQFYSNINMPILFDIPLKSGFQKL